MKTTGIGYTFVLEVDQRVRQATGRTAVDDDAVTGDEIRPFRRETQHRLGGLPGCSEPFERILVEPAASDVHLDPPCRVFEVVPPELSPGRTG